MDNQVKVEISSHELAGQLGLTAIGPDIPITLISPLSDVREGTLCFSKAPLASGLGLPATVIVSAVEDIGSGSVILSANPRLDFARALVLIDSLSGFRRSEAEPQVHPTARIGRGTVLSPGVIIGAGTIIHSNVVIGRGVEIGERCVIKSGTVIGEDGFGFERNEDGIPIRLVHLGGVTIGDEVELGSLNTVCRGTLSSTVVENYVKTDDHVHIAHNCRVRRGALITACVELSGGVDVGENAWLGPNSSVMQKVRIGDGALVGIGSNVRKNVNPGVTVAGNPAKVLVRK